MKLRSKMTPPPVRKTLYNFNQNLIILDIDGCLVDSEHRLPHLFKNDLDAYHAAHREDTPIPQGVFLYRALVAHPTFHCLFVTGRMESARQYTLDQINWLLEPKQPVELLMRPDGMTSKQMHDTELKPWLIEQAGYSLDQIFMVFEDRNCIVDMWRKRGITCYQTQNGDF